VWHGQSISSSAATCMPTLLLARQRHAPWVAPRLAPNPPTPPLLMLPAPLPRLQVGPRACLNPIKMFAGSFGGPVIYENATYVSPNTVSGGPGWRVGDCVRRRGGHLPPIWL
jgi:hypothetical protein